MLMKNDRDIHILSVPEDKSESIINVITQELNKSVTNTNKFKNMNKSEFGHPLRVKSSMTPVKPTKSYMDMTQSRQAQIKDTSTNTETLVESKSAYQN